MKNSFTIKWLLKLSPVLLFAGFIDNASASSPRPSAVTLLNKAGSTWMYCTYKVTLRNGNERQESQLSTSSKTMTIDLSPYYHTGKLYVSMRGGPCDGGQQTVPAIYHEVTFTCQNGQLGYSGK